MDHQAKRSTVLRVFCAWVTVKLKHSPEMIKHSPELESLGLERVVLVQTTDEGKAKEIIVAHWKRCNVQFDEVEVRSSESGILIIT
jgi:hypothetical protein